MNLYLRSSESRLTRRHFLRQTALALPVFAAGCRTVPKHSARDAEFVVVHHGRLERGGKPYLFLGANFPTATRLADPSLAGGQAKVRHELDQLHRLGVTNLRLLAGSEGSLAANGYRGITRAPGEWDEELLLGLDFLLAEMAKRDMTGVLYLTNYWEWSGGMARYVSWATGEPIPDPAKPGATLTFADWMRFAARFYSTPRAQAMFRETVTHVVTRRNTITGRLYVDDPTIMSWQLANEPRPGPDEPATEANIAAFCAWTDETARLLKSLAPRQLISTGSEGTIGCIGRAEVFLQAHRSPAVDYVTLHLWVKNWGWLKEPRLGPHYEEAAARARQHVEQHISLAAQLGKPLVMEEFGIARDDESREPQGTTRMRDDYYDRMFHGVLDSCRAGRSLQGANFWAWDTVEARRKAAPLDINSVLRTDQSTLAVIARHNQQLRSVAQDLAAS
jgi:mannan endo-1,4-beta-mannosidase